AKASHQTPITPERERGDPLAARDGMRPASPATLYRFYRVDRGGLAPLEVARPVDGRAARPGQTQAGLRVVDAEDFGGAAGSLAGQAQSLTAAPGPGRAGSQPAHRSGRASGLGATAVVEGKPRCRAKRK